MSLEIRKLASKSFKHIDSIDGTFILTKFYAKIENNKFLIVEIYGSKRREYSIDEISVFDIGGTAETFSNFEDLESRLKELKYTAYYFDGGNVFNFVESVNGSMVDNTDTSNPIIESDVTKLDKDFTILPTADAPLNDADLFVIYQDEEAKQLYFDDLEASFKRGTFTIDLMDLKTANFYAPNDLKINSIVNVKNAPTTTLKKNDVAYTLGTLISKGDKITVETNIFSVVNLIVKYE